LEQEITSKLNANNSRVIETKLKDYYGVTEHNQTNLRESDYNEANTIGNALEFLAGLESQKNEATMVNEFGSKCTIFKPSYTKKEDRSA
jgi:hypothetical protein